MAEMDTFYMLYLFIYIFYPLIWLYRWILKDPFLILDLGRFWIFYILPFVYFFIYTLHLFHSVFTQTLNIKVIH